MLPFPAWKGQFLGKNTKILRKHINYMRMKIAKRGCFGMGTMKMRGVER
jgi:hypothetical protein